MKLFKLLSILLITSFLSSCSIQKELPDGRKYFQLVEFNDMHFLNITLNGKKTKLLIDTGASKSLLDISQAENFGFEYVLISREQYIGIGGLQDINVVYNYNIEEIYIFCLGTDLSEVIGYFTRNGIHIAGIIGSDFIEGNKVTIDFVKNRMYYK